MPTQEELSQQRNRPPMYVPVKVGRTEAAYLYNLLCDNARPWNKRLRAELANFVTPTDSHNAKMKLLGRM